MKRILFLLALPLTMLTGCNEETAEPQTPSSAGERITFKIGFDAAADNGNPQTRVVTDDYEFTNQWEDGDKIGISGVVNGRTLISNLPLTYNRATDSWSGNVFWPAGVNSMDFEAYYPYDASNGNTIRVRLDQSTAQNHSLSNMLTSSAPNVTAGEAVPLSFSPANALIQLTIIDSYMTLDPAEELTVTLRDVAVWLGSRADVKMFRMADGVTFRAFVFPDHGPFSFTIPAGTSMFLIQSGDLTFRSAPLEDGIDLKRGNAEMFSQSIPGDPARVIDPGVVVEGLRWATRNVGRQGTFAATPYVYDGEYQYFWDEATSPANGTGTDDSICPAGWRMPTRKEYADLMAAATNKGPATSESLPDGGILPDGGFGGVYTTNPGWVDTEPKGMNVETPGGTLFFSASGLNKGTLSQGTYGACWLSTPVPTLNNSAYSIYFSETQVQMSAHTGGRYRQMSVRCVAEV